MAKSNFNTDFYVYIHCRASDGRVFYVGKGSGQRAYVSQGRNRYWLNIVKKHGFTVSIIQDGMQEWWAHELECELIALYGRETLCNLTDGGEGVCGHVPSAETLQKLSLIRKGRTVSAATRKLLSESQAGKPRSAISLEKMRITKSKPECKEKMTGSKNPMKNPINKKKLSDFFKNKKQPKISGALNYKARKVVCQETKMIFDTVTFAKDWLVSQGFSKAATSPISKCCNGKYRHAYGFHWKYA